MGIRVHKVLGYGLTDLKFKKTKSSIKMVDERIDWEKYEERFYSYNEENFENLISWMENNKDSLQILLDNEYIGCKLAIDISSEIGMVKSFKNGKAKASFLSDCIIHNSEYGLPNVMVLVAPSNYKEWFRYDDIIDWEEETFKNDGRGRVIKLNNSGIYPYNSCMFRFRKPKKSFAEDSYAFEHCDELGPVLIMPAAYSQLVGRWDKKRGPTATGDFLQHLKKDFRPRLPLDILALFQWSQIFKSVDTINDLRPIIYVYWS
jgi:hypothetical protein